MATKTTTKRTIRNPEKWIGKYVRGMANWHDFEYDWNRGYFVCEFSGKLYRMADEAFPCFEEERAAYESVGYDVCYTYSMEAIVYFQKASGYAE